MTEQTDNHDWTIPTVGGDNNQWGQVLNDFFDGSLDNDVTLRGTFSERPDASSSDVKLFLATDRRIVYHNQGSSWEAVYGLGTDANPVPGTSHFESVSAEELSGGIAGGQTINSVFGSQNELVGLATVSFASIDKSFTSMNYTDLTTEAELCVVTPNNYVGLTNITELRANWTIPFIDPGTNTSIDLQMDVTQSGGDNFTFGENNFTAAENRVTVPEETVALEGGDAEFVFQGQTSDGDSATVRGVPTVEIYGVIG